MSTYAYTEDQFVEQPAIGLFAELGWATASALEETFGVPSPGLAATLGDGSAVTYHWYRFADQPALLNADITGAERAAMHSRVENLHRSWNKDRDYLPPPALGKLVKLDPAVVVTPPKGLEVGYVPIVTRQAANN